MLFSDATLGGPPGREPSGRLAVSLPETCMIRDTPPAPRYTRTNVRLNEFPAAAISGTVLDGLCTLWVTSRPRRRKLAPLGIGRNRTTACRLTPVPRQFVAVTTSLFSPGDRSPPKRIGPKLPPVGRITDG